MTTVEMFLTEEGLDGALLADEVGRLSTELLPTLYQRGIAHTPLENYDLAIPDVPGGYLLDIKDESRQKSGSFKFRGATAAIEAALRDAEYHEETLRCVTTATDGNHGKAVAAAARAVVLEGRVNQLATIVEAPIFMDSERRRTLRASGATVHAYHADFESARDTARLAGSYYGHAYIEPFDSVETMSGQASVAHEMLTDLQAQQERGGIDLLHDEITVFVGVAGGGLAAACAAVFDKAHREGLLGNKFQLVGAQMEYSDAMARQLAGSRPLSKEELDTTIESTALLEAGKKTKAILEQSRTFTGIEVLSRREVGEAMLALEVTHGRTEPAAALALAASMRRMRAQGEPTDGRVHKMIVLRCGGGDVTDEVFEGFATEASAEFRHSLGKAAAVWQNDRDITQRIADFKRLSEGYANRTVYGMAEIAARWPYPRSARLGSTCLNGATERAYIYLDK